ncbi:MAG: hypothetical protein ACLSVD_11995 [Eggerthellaceae bacterium]
MAEKTTSCSSACPAPANLPRHRAGEDLEHDFIARLNIRTAATRRCRSSSTRGPRASSGGEQILPAEPSKSIIATGSSAYTPTGHEASRRDRDHLYLKITYDQLVSRLSDLQERGVVLKEASA